MNKPRSSKLQRRQATDADQTQVRETKLIDIWTRSCYNILHACMVAVYIGQGIPGLNVGRSWCSLLKCGKKSNILTIQWRLLYWWPAMSRFLLCSTATNAWRLHVHSVLPYHCWGRNFLCELIIDKESRKLPWIVALALNKINVRCRFQNIHGIQWRNCQIHKILSLETWFPIMWHVLVQNHNTA